MKRNWTVILPGRPPFTMGSTEAMSKSEALHVVRCIFGEGRVM